MENREHEFYENYKTTKEREIIEMKEAIQTIKLKLRIIFELLEDYKFLNNCLNSIFMYEKIELEKMKDKEVDEEH